ncbi:hypothetical protein ACQ86N_25080 [Puia sp. P3]|uniref:hypothetical protein n=1 Tax=Puia sp. P3 TaxID=3423952 RepID=UPI003D67EF41
MPVVTATVSPPTHSPAQNSILSPRTPFSGASYKTPKRSPPPICDSLNTNGVALVQVKTNLGYSLITVLTLGIWCPMQLEWKCSKPCQVTGHL